MRAELTRINIGEVVANRAAPDRSFHFDNRFRELGRIRGIHFQDKEGEALCGFGSDAWKFLELFDQPVDGFCYIHATNQIMPGIFIPPARLPS